MEAYYDYKLKERKNHGFLIRLILKIMAFFGIFTMIFFFNSTILSKPIQTEFNTATVVKTVFSFLKDKETSTIKGETTDKINILFLGTPGKGNSAPNLTDSIILLSIKPSTKQIALLSIPRDLLVYLPKEKRYTKINALFIMNEKNPKLIEDKIKEITGEKVHYYFVLDTTAVKKIVDDLGGLNVFVKKDIYDSAFPTKDFKTETFEVKKGWRYFDGETVQKYLRTRHSQNGDFDRMEQQQAVIEALRKKVFGLNLFLDLPKMFSMLQTISDNIQTNISDKEIRRFYELVKNVSYDKINNEVLNGGQDNSLLSAGSFMFGKTRGFVLKPKKGDFDYTEIQDLAENIFNQ
jgi:LCP family protein required for cell wall assembly